MGDYCKFSDLGYRPSCGMIDVRGNEGDWTVKVSVEQGRALEADGVPVRWPYSSCPGFVANLGLAGLWMTFERAWSWPSRWSR